MILCTCFVIDKKILQSNTENSFIAYNLLRFDDFTKMEIHYHLIKTGLDNRSTTEPMLSSIGSEAR